ncbi:MAG: hypothetical protein LBR12_02460 [Opitutaceae bacterium]|jgi:hypothetical protein|nr:hypothetical protein [Opitutaceae bacterium]
MRKFYDKLLLGLALLALALSAALCLPQGGEDAASARLSVPSKPYEPAGMDAPVVKTELWERPAGQSAGPEWIYDLFTPPEIYYSVATKKFTVTPPLDAGAAASREAPFPVGLLQIRQDVFPLQLVGYVGEGARATGLFESAADGEGFRARLTKEGRVYPHSSKERFDALGLALEAFKCERVRIESEGSMPLYDTVATASVLIKATGERVTLTNKERLVRGAPAAVLRAEGLDAPLELRDGGTFDAGGFHYTVRSVTAVSVEIEQTPLAPADPASEPVRKTLTIGGVAAPLAPAP